MKKMIYGTDYHMHTRYSDGKREPEAYIEAALKLGLKEIGFSDHLNPSGGDLLWCMDHKRLPEYAEHILRLKKEHSDIAVRLGIEIDYLPGKEKETELIINSLPFDYIIGSVHYLGAETVDLGPEFYIGKDIDLIYENYFNLVCEAASTGFFDIMGHPDLVRIHRFRPDADITHLYSMMASAFEIHDVAFELNTNGRNKPLHDFYPDRKYLHIFAEHGVPVCVNSDAHFPERTGQFFGEAYEILRRAGYREMAVFDRRERYMIPL
ncbi:MAG: histidinol-phosphatase HisJ family protein [Bacteroidota bacterium]|jgi:histidinol-phosphatase (PHP family)|nr:histidinol-phosphatase HisJ family protein [Bacteroidota bacterium]